MRNLKYPIVNSAAVAHTTDPCTTRTDLQYIAPHFWCVCQEIRIFSSLHRQMIQLWHLKTNGLFHINKQNTFVAVIESTYLKWGDKVMKIVSPIIQCSMLIHTRNGQRDTKGQWHICIHAMPFYFDRSHKMQILLKPSDGPLVDVCSFVCHRCRSNPAHFKAFWLAV